MDVHTIERELQARISELIRLRSEGIDRYRVFTPFRFSDGDHLAMVLKQENEHWILSDEGHTYMHLTYELDEGDLLQGTRQTIIANALSAFGVDDLGGELRIDIPAEQFGDALYSFIQALLKISDVTFLSRERVRTTFFDDFKAFMIATIPEERRIFDWHHPELDRDGKYSVNCRINQRAKQVFVYALQNDAQTRDATISLLQFEKWGVEFESVAIFENQEEINRRVLARFSDVCDKQFSNLDGNKERITPHLQELMRIT
ncbi:MAG TPA: DUF1828 domain-containing protein [Dehalococcoidia bacterium]|nr:DUF1828 domain-containing protein [Dehalococcoidia bacterium]